MSTQRNEYQPIFSYLRSLNFHFLDTWVMECVNYYKSANPNISLDILKNEVKQQWLLVNLREIKVPSLPAGLRSKDKIILNGSYAVQVESMIDSSLSCYSQFQKLLKVDTDDIETTKATRKVEPKSKRCLTFVICDGVQELEAMEYQPIKKIKTNDAELLPGFKMVIIGPVECRKGMILLKDENVRICGGEVDTLTVTNSLKRVLMRKLQLDEADYPEAASPNHEEEEEEKESSENPSHTPVVPAEAQPQFQEDKFEDTCIESLLSQNDDVFLSLPPETEILGQQTQTVEQTSRMQDVEFEDVFLDDDLHIWTEVNVDNHLSNSRKHALPQEDLKIPSPKRRSLDRDTGLGSFTTQNSLDMDEEKDMFINDFDEPPSVATSSVSKVKKPVQTTLSSYFKNCDTSLDKYRTSNQNNLIYVSNKPFVYLKQIMSLELKKPTIFLFKAVILTLKTKIRIENDEFHLKASITDGSLSVDVDFSSIVLEDLLGFSPCEMAVMIKAKQTNSAIAQRIKESFAKAQDKLISLNCLMEIKFFTDGRRPVILSLEEVSMHHLRALKERKLVK